MQGQARVQLMVTCSRQLTFCAGHRVKGHENKCANVHGHNYRLIVTAHAPDLDAIGRVIDFSVLKERIGGWIEQEWDHTMILGMDDGELGDLIQPFNKKPVAYLEKNPTAENLAAYLLREVCPVVLHDTGVEVVEVELWETDNCKATVRKEPNPPMPPSDATP